MPKGAATDNVVLVNAVFNLSFPLRAAPDFIFAAISFDDEHILRLQPPPVQFPVHEFKFLDVI